MCNHYANRSSNCFTVPYLCTERRDFKTFHLRVEGRINAGGTAGIFFRKPYDPNDTHGYGITNTSQKFPGKARLCFGTAEGLVGSIESMVASGQWFSMEAIVSESDVEVRLDGQSTFHHHLGQGQALAPSQIVIQRLPMTVTEFRKIEIKEFRRTQPRAATGSKFSG
jgi:hypothetical protein